MPNHHLPTKTCATCGRDFAWRKKWERDWEGVKYCSKKCGALARTVAKSPHEPAPTLPPARPGL